MHCSLQTKSLPNEGGGGRELDGWEGLVTAAHPTSPPRLVRLSLGWNLQPPTPGLPPPYLLLLQAGQ